MKKPYCVGLSLLQLVPFVSIPRLEHQRLPDRLAARTQITSLVSAVPANLVNQENWFGRQTIPHLT